METLDSTWNKRPNVLAYHHAVADHFPCKEEFEREAVDVRFAGPLAIEGDDSDVWGYTPESMKIYTGPNRAAVVISKVSEDNKFSKGYNACTGIAAVGRDKVTGKNISFLAHCDPYCLLGKDPMTPDEQQVILEKLSERVREMKERCKPSELSFEIVGGGYTNTVNMNSLYQSSITKLGDVVEGEVGTRPWVAFGPNNELERSHEDNDKELRPLHPGAKNTDVYVDTKHAGVIVIRPEQRNSRWNNGFVAPKDWEAWKSLYETDVGKNDGLFPLGANTTPSLELWLQNPDRWRELYGNKKSIDN